MWWCLLVYLTNLELLDLSRNRFNGSIPLQGSCPCMVVFLFMSGNFNYWIGSYHTFLWLCLLAELSDMRKLKALDLSDNEFSGSTELKGKFPL